VVHGNLGAKFLKGLEVEIYGPGPKRTAPWQCHFSLMPASNQWPGHIKRSAHLGDEFVGSFYRIETAGIYDPTVGI
jgi:hypothetical protein